MYDKKKKLFFVIYKKNPTNVWNIWTSERKILGNIFEYLDFDYWQSKMRLYDSFF